MQRLRNQLSCARDEYDAAADKLDALVDALARANRHGAAELAEYYERRIAVLSQEVSALEREVLDQLAELNRRVRAERRSRQ